MTDPNLVPDSRASQAFVAEARALLSGEYLSKIERCLETLTDEQLWWRANEQSNSIGNLLLHLSGNARQWIVVGLGGAVDQRRRQSEFDQRAVISKAELISRLKETLADVDAVLDGFDPALLLATYHIQASDVSALHAILHVVEHFSMHTGQIILLTKLLTESDLRFYDFSTGGPVHTWHEPRSSSQ